MFIVDSFTFVYNISTSLFSTVNNGFNNSNFQIVVSIKEILERKLGHNMVYINKLKLFY